MSHTTDPNLPLFPELTPEAQVPKADPDVLAHRTVDSRIWHYIRDQGERGATIFEVDTALELVGRSTAGARIRMLVRAGRLRDTGTRRRTTGRHTARVYEAVTPRELEALPAPGRTGSPGG